MTKPKDKIIAPAIPKKKADLEAAGKRYWKNPISFKEFGVRKGLVSEEEELAFKASSPDSDILAWTSKTDEAADRLKELKARRRKELGLDTEA